MICSPDPKAWLLGFAEPRVLQYLVAGEPRGRVELERRVYQVLERLRGMRRVDQRDIEDLLVQLFVVFACVTQEYL